MPLRSAAVRPQLAVAPEAEVERVGPTGGLTGGELVRDGGRDEGMLSRKRGAGRGELGADCIVIDAVGEWPMVSRLVSGGSAKDIGVPTGERLCVDVVRDETALPFNHRSLPGLETGGGASSSTGDPSERGRGAAAGGVWEPDAPCATCWSAECLLNAVSAPKD